MAPIGKKSGREQTDSVLSSQYEQMVFPSAVRDLRTSRGGRDFAHAETGSVVGRKKRGGASDETQAQHRQGVWLGKQPLEAVSSYGKIKIISLALPVAVRIN